MQGGRLPPGLAGLLLKFLEFRVVANELTKGALGRGQGFVVSSVYATKGVRVLLRLFVLVLLHDLVMLAGDALHEQLGRVDVGVYFLERVLLLSELSVGETSEEAVGKCEGEVVVRVEGVLLCHVEESLRLCEFVGYLFALRLIGQCNTSFKRSSAVLLPGWRLYLF